MKYLICLTIFLLQPLAASAQDSCTFVGATNSDGSATGTGAGTVYYNPASNDSAAFSVIYHFYQTDGNGNTVDWFGGSSSGPFTTSPQGEERVMSSNGITPFGPATVHVDCQSDGRPLVESSQSYKSETPGVTIVGVYQVDNAGAFSPLVGATVSCVDVNNGAFFSQSQPTYLRQSTGGGSQQQTYETFGVDPTGAITTDAPYAPGPNSDTYRWECSCPGYVPVQQTGATNNPGVAASYPGTALVLLMTPTGSGVTSVPSSSVPTVPPITNGSNNCSGSGSSSGPVPSGTYTIPSFSNTDPTNTGGGGWSIVGPGGNDVDDGQQGSPGPNGWSLTSSPNGGPGTLTIPAMVSGTAGYVASGSQFTVEYKDSRGLWTASLTMGSAGASGTSTPCSSTPGTTTTPTTDGSFLSNFWQSFETYMQSLFVPPQSDIDALHTAATQLLSYGPLGLFSSFIADASAAFTTPNGGPTDPNYWYIPLYFKAFIGSPTDTSSAPSNISEDPNACDDPEGHAVPCVDGANDTTGIVNYLASPMYNAANPSNAPSTPVPGGGIIPTVSPSGMYPLYMDCNPVSFVILKARIVLVFAAWASFLIGLYRWLLPKVRVKL